MDKEALLDIYSSILLPRMVEEKMLLLLRQGKISKWFSGIGQEAISVGITKAMDFDEYVLPMHRNLGVFTEKKLPLDRLFAQFMGKNEGYTKGRDRSFHFGVTDHYVIGMISHLGAQLGVADGIALSKLLSKEKKATVVFTGDGGASEGDFHEAINTAAVWNLPVVFVVENNGYGLSTPSSEQFKCKQFIDKGIGFGIEAIQLDGNNILEVYTKMQEILSSVRENPRPILVECMTFRMRGHEEASGVKYIPKELFELWGKKDPVQNLERYLLDQRILDEETVVSMKSSIKEHIDTQWKKAESYPDLKIDKTQELNDVYKSYSCSNISPSEKGEEMRMVDAISIGLDQIMDQNDNLVLMGQDIAEYGGVFKITDGFVEKFGKGRVRNTPLCESAILGAAVGLSIAGYKSMVEMQFADFVSEGITQITNNMAKLHYRWGQHVDTVIRMPTGAGVAAGPFHSQSNEMWFAHIPGLKIAYPAFPKDAKGLLATSFEDPNPVMFFEHKALYRSVKQQVPQSYYTIPFGKSAIVNEGTRVTIITYGMGVHWALDLANEYDIEVIDLRTLVPLDVEGIKVAVKKTGRAIVLHEDTLFAGIGGEISAYIMENCFEYLDAPVRRVGSMDTPVPFNARLEEQFLPKDRLKEVVKEVLEY